jgi:hypothetical protein
MGPLGVPCLLRVPRGVAAIFLIGFSSVTQLVSGLGSLGATFGILLAHPPRREQARE